MPSTATPVSICNQAMSWLGANLITSFDDGTTEANLCKANYDQLRDAVLETYYWSFATRRSRLNAVEPPPIDPDALVYSGHKFAVPTDSIRIWKGSNNPDFMVGSNVPWTLENNFIYSGFAPFYMKYTYRLVETTKMSPSFVQALAARIAVDLCLPITESNNKLQAMQALYAVKLDEAKTTDGMQGTNERIRSTWMRRSRSQTSFQTG